MPPVLEQVVPLSLTADNTVVELTYGSFSWVAATSTSHVSLNQDGSCVDSEDTAVVGLSAGDKNSNFQSELISGNNEINPVDGHSLKW